jgi:BirA family biotin operon repressor/biotin-[acetyl-CoA-carboxylase] ligase
MEPILDVVDDTRFANVQYVAKTGSTNDDAQKVLGTAQAAGKTFVAEEQTDGKGRRTGRRWIAPPGTSLLFTTVLPDPLPATDLWVVPFWAALCVGDGIRRASGLGIELRWPNDCFVRTGKVAGILCVSRVSGERAHVAVGVGINVARPVGAAAPRIDPPAGYVVECAPRPVSRELILAETLLAYNRRLRALSSPDVIARTYGERAGLDGARYRVRMDIDGRELDGIARGIGPDGALRLEVAGSEQLISLADARRL